MECVIQIIGIARLHGTEHSQHSGQYLRDFDPDAYRGRGRVRTTPDLAHAQRFADADVAMRCWKQQSRSHPLRDDGKPNCPLTAYTCELVPVMEQPAGLHRR